MGVTTMVNSTSTWLRIARAAALAGAAVLADQAIARDAAAQVEIYQHSHFRGRHTTVGGAVNNLTDYGYNDVVSSIRVYGGSWEICEHAYFRGRCVVINRDVTDMVNLGMNDQISSIRPVRGNWGGWGRVK